MIYSQFSRLWRSAFPRRMAYDSTVDFYRFMRYGPWINRIRVSRWFWLLLLILAYDLYWGDRWWLFYRWIPLVPYFNFLLQEGAPWLFWIVDHLLQLVAFPVQWSQELNRIVAEQFGVWRDGWYHQPFHEYFHPFVRKGVEHRFQEKLYRLHPRSVKVYAHGIRYSWQWLGPLLFGFLLLLRYRLWRRALIWPDFEPVEEVDYFSTPEMFAFPRLPLAHHPIYLEFQYYPFFLYYARAYVRWQRREQSYDLQYQYLYPGEELLWLRSDWKTFDSYYLEWYPFQLFFSWLLWLVFRIPLALLVLLLLPLLFPPIFLYVSVVRPVLRATLFRLWWSVCWLLSFPLNPILRRVHPTVVGYFRLLRWIRKDFFRHFFNRAIDAWLKWEGRERFILSTMSWTIEREFVTQANWYQRQRIFMRLFYINRSLSNLLLRFFNTLYRFNVRLATPLLWLAYHGYRLGEQLGTRYLSLISRFFSRLPRLLRYLQIRIVETPVYQQVTTRYRTLKAEAVAKEEADWRLQVYHFQQWLVYSKEDAVIERRRFKRQQREMAERRRRRGEVEPVEWLIARIWTDRIACFDFLYRPPLLRLAQLVAPLQIRLRGWWSHYRQEVLPRRGEQVRGWFRLVIRLLRSFLSVPVLLFRLIRWSLRFFFFRLPLFLRSLPVWVQLGWNLSLCSVRYSSLWLKGYQLFYLVEGWFWDGLVWIGQALPRRLPFSPLLHLFRFRTVEWTPFSFERIRGKVVNWLDWVPLRLTGWGVHRMRRLYGIRYYFRLGFLLAFILLLVSPVGLFFFTTFDHHLDLTHMVWTTPIACFALWASPRLREWAWWDLRDFQMLFNFGLLGYIYGSHMTPYTWERLFYLKLVVLGARWIWATIVVPLATLYAYLFLPLVEVGNWLMEGLVKLIVVATLPCYQVLILLLQLLLDLLPASVWLIGEWVLGWTITILIPIGFILLSIGYLLFFLVVGTFGLISYDTWTWFRLNWQMTLGMIVLWPLYVLGYLLLKLLLRFMETTFYVEVVDPTLQFFWWFVDKNIDPGEPKMWWFIGWTIPF